MAAIVAVVVVGGGGAAWAMTRSSTSGNDSTQVVAAKLATINQTVSTSGTVAPAHEADLDFASTGRVTRVKVAVGDKVTKGQTLATIGTAALTSKRRLGQGELTPPALTALSEAAGGASTAIAAAHASLIAARSQLSTAKRALNNAHLRATIDGTIASLSLTKGEAVITDLERRQLGLPGR